MKHIRDVSGTIDDVMSLTVVNRGNNPSLSLPCKFVRRAWFLEGMILRRFFLNTWVARGKSREEARHTHGCARCEYVANTTRLGVSDCMCRKLRIL